MFHVNALSYDNKKIDNEVASLKRAIMKNNKLVTWNEQWEKEALNLFKSGFKAALEPIKISDVLCGFRLNDPKNRLRTNEVAELT